MKKAAIIIALVNVIIFAQAEYVPVVHKIYPFLERMDALRIINYNGFETPITRGDAGKYLNKIEELKGRLRHSDAELLEDLLSEYEFDAKGSLENTQSLLGSGDYKFSTDKENFLYHHSSDKGNIFVNLIGEAEFLWDRDIEGGSTSKGFLGIIGGEVRGTFLNKIGFYMMGTNGKSFGDKNAALLRSEVRYNYKFNENVEERFFDNSIGYLTADLDIVKFQLGRDRKRIGYGEVKPIVEAGTPMFDFISMKANYEFLDFSFIHGRLLGRHQYIFDPVTLGSYNVEEKYLVYHRLGIDLGGAFNLGMGEIIIYGNRGFDLSYLNPLIFYKSLEHSNKDRDNSMIFVDIKNKSIKGLNLFGTLLIDDIDFSKLGSGWWGNQFLLSGGFKSSNLYELIPVDISGEYLRIEPYTYTHRLGWNNYTQGGLPLGAPMEPNSHLFLLQADYRFTNTLILGTRVTYMEHGANPVDNLGNVSNVGGDIMLGHRSFDRIEAKFLDGDMEYFRSYTAVVNYEPLNILFVTLQIDYINESLQGGVKNSRLQGFINTLIVF